MNAKEAKEKADKLNSQDLTKPTNRLWRQIQSKIRSSVQKGQYKCYVPLTGLNPKIVPLLDQRLRNNTFTVLKDTSGTPNNLRVAYTISWD
jgi:hypothetical protein